MWLSRIITKNKPERSAQTGEVTLSSSENWEAGAFETVRNISSYLPYGYSSVAPVGEEVLLLPADDTTVMLGAKAQVNSLAAGEIKIRSRGGACIELKNDGSIVLNGRVTINKNGEVIR